MPTTNPRIAVTLSQPDYDLLQRVANLQGVSMAALLRDYVEMSRPMLEHLVSLGEAMESAMIERREVHMQAVERAMNTGEALATHVINGFADAGEWLERVNDGLKSDLPASEMFEAAAAPLTPDGSNRGVRSLRKGKAGSRRGSE